MKLQPHARKVTKQEVVNALRCRFMQSVHSLPALHLLFVVHLNPCACCTTAEVTNLQGTFQTVSSIRPISITITFDGPGSTTQGHMNLGIASKPRELQQRWQRFDLLLQATLGIRIYTSECNKRCLHDLARSLIFGLCIQLPNSLTLPCLTGKGLVAINA